MLSASDFVISQTLADQLDAFLDSKSTVLSESPPEGVGASFGAAPASRGCASDAGKARDHVRAAIIDMSAGLEEFRKNIRLMQQRVRDADEVAQADLKQKFDAAQACQAPTFAAPSQCTVPGNSTEEG